MLTLSALIVCAALCAPPARTLGLPPVVHLQIETDGGLTESALRVAADQTRLIWSDTGVTVTAGRPTDSVPAGATIVAVRIESTDPRRTDGHTVLAWVTLDERRMPGPIHVSLPALQQLLLRADFHNRPVSESTRGVVERLTAQAVGRVVAHELGHYLLRSSRHLGTGLMRPHYSGADLVGPSLAPFQIAARQLIALRRPPTG